MSHSTKVRVTIGPTSVEYTHGSGSVASDFGVDEIRKPLIMQGHAAVGTITSGLAEFLLPSPELGFVRSCLVRWEEFIGHDPEDAELNTRLRNQVWVEITRFD